MRTPKLAFVGFFLLSAALIATPAYQEKAPAETSHVPSSSFSAGEHLVYVVKWDPPWYFFFLPSMEAGEIDLEMVGESEYSGKKALKISFQARSSGTLMKMTGMNIDDEFVFFTEPKTYCTFSASKKIREGKRKRQIDIKYLRETKQLHIRELDEAVVPPKLKKDETKDNIPPCVQDPLSALYFYRLSPLRVGHLQTLVIGHDDRVKEISARVEKQEDIETPAGKFSAWRVSVLSLMGGLFKEGGQFLIWFSADEKKVPLQFEFRVRLGRVLGKLESR
jgi:hypothetical protein